MLIVDVEDVLHPMTSLLSEPDSAILCLIIKASISPDGPEGKDALLFSALHLLLSCTTRSFSLQAPSHPIVHLSFNHLLFGCFQFDL